MLFAGGKLSIRFLKKEGIIFAAGVLCGFFIRTLMAKSDASVNHQSQSSEDDNSLENYILSMKKQIEDWGKQSDSGQNNQKELAPECFMKVPEIIQYAGYPFELHTVMTSDGYNLGLHRIPHGKDEAEDKKLTQKPVVLLQHGLLADSANWVSNGRNDSLAFLLADYGLDVWLGNVRGNTYSRSHVKLDPNVDEKFWRYSWQQFSEIDLPAMVDYIIEKTGNKKIYYIGHSQGTLIMFARLAEDPDFNEKIHLFIGLGPVFNLKGIKSPIKYLAQFYNTLEMGQWMMGGAELLPNSEAGKWLGTKLHNFIEGNPDVKIHGENMLLNIAGFSPRRYCRDRLPVYISHIPAGTSIQNIIHFAQMIWHNETRKYRFDTEESNIEKYGSAVPPGYDLGAIKTPIALYWGSDDWFADSEDVLSILPRLKTLVKTKELKDWDHLEFLYGSEAADTLYTELAEVIKDFEIEFQNYESRHVDL
ncbi:lysosomal acid lipase/cholesteryl ester hydrolase-like isoform X1 [Styela clava]